jgi:hypothetical protein
MLATRRYRLAAIATLALLSLSSFGCAHSSSRDTAPYEVLLTPAPAEWLHSEKESFIHVQTLAVAPDGALVVSAMPPSPHGVFLYRALPEGWDPEQVQLSESATVRQIALSEDFHLFHADSDTIQVHDYRWEHLRNLSGQEMNASAGLVLLDDGTLFGLGNFADSPWDGRQPVREWVEAHRRFDCPIFKVSLNDGEPAPKAVVCSEEFDRSEKALLLPWGAVGRSLDGRRVFALLERAPWLYVISGDGRLLERKTWLRPGESAPVVVESDLQRQRDGSFHHELRARFRLPMGLVPVDTETMALVSRTFSDDGAEFWLDLFDLDGNPIGEPLHLSLPVRGNGAYAMPIFNPAGDPLLLVTERDEGALVYQRLFSMTLD